MFRRLIKLAASRIASQFEGIKHFRFVRKAVAFLISGGCLTILLALLQLLFATETHV